MDKEEAVFDAKSQEMAVLRQKLAAMPAEISSAEEQLRIDKENFDAQMRGVPLCVLGLYVYSVVTVPAAPKPELKRLFGCPSDPVQ